MVTLYGSDRIITLPSLIYQNLGSYRTNDAAGLVLYLAIDHRRAVAYCHEKDAR